MDEMTPGEIARLLDSLRKSMEDIRNDMKESLSEIRQQYANFVLQAQYRSDQKAVEEDIKDIKEEQKWNRRAIAGLFSTVVAGLIVVYLTSGAR